MKLVDRLSPALKNIILPYYVRHQDERLVGNYYQTDFKKRVLISYINFPFLKQGTNYAHTNYGESFAIADIFKKLQFNVDIVNHNRRQPVNYNDYDVIFGFGQVLSKSFSAGPARRRIYYGTGAHPYISNQKTLARARAVFDQTGRWMLESTRLVKEDYLLQTTMVDGLVILGNDFTASTYREFTDRPLFTIPASFYQLLDYQEIIATKDFSSAKNNFLFFSGPGLIHKGLDLLLPIFLEQPDWHLHLCVQLAAEREFNSFFASQLSRANIHQHGFVGLASPLFRELLTTCAFVVLPSCSEGTPSSVLNVMGNGGLIPITTREAGVDRPEGGVAIAATDRASVQAALITANSRTAEEIRQQSLVVGQTTTRQHSLGEFSAQLERSLRLLLKI